MIVQRPCSSSGWICACIGNYFLPADVLPGAYVLLYAGEVVYDIDVSGVAYGISYAFSQDEQFTCLYSVGGYGETLTSVNGLFPLVEPLYGIVETYLSGIVAD